MHRTITFFLFQICVLTVLSAYRLKGKKVMVQLEHCTNIENY